MNFETGPFYRAALIGLRHLDSRERSPRRFGPDADARWESFRGHLGLANRIDLLIRDATVTWKAAFSPAEIFSLPGLASDEPFGPDWQGLAEHDAREIWHNDTADAGMADCARVLGLGEAPVELPAVTPSTRLVVAGGAACVAVAEVFASQTDLSWSDQVLVVAEEPAGRQLAGLVAPLLAAKSATRLVAPQEDVVTTMKEVGFSSGGLAIVSNDATASERAFVDQATGHD